MFYYTDQRNTFHWALHQAHEHVQWLKYAQFLQYLAMAYSDA